MRTRNDTNLENRSYGPISIQEQPCEIWAENARRRRDRVDSGRKSENREDEPRLRSRLPPAGFPEAHHLAGDGHAGPLHAVPVGVMGTPDNLAVPFFLHFPAADIGSRGDREPSRFTSVLERLCVHT